MRAKYLHEITASRHAEWAQRHHHAANGDVRRTTAEAAIVGLANAITSYVNTAAQGYTEDEPWRDYVLGAAVGDLLQGFIGLLNGDLGRLDGGLCDAWAREVADFIGFDLDTDEMRTT